MSDTKTHEAALNDALLFVMNHATTDEVETLHNALNARLKTLAAQRAKVAAGLGEGARVRLVNLRPQYLEGLTGKIEMIEQVSRNKRVAHVRLDEASTNRLREGNHTMRPHPTEREYVISGVPFTALEAVQA